MHSLPPPNIRTTMKVLNQSLEYGLMIMQLCMMFRQVYVAVIFCKRSVLVPRKGRRQIYHIKYSLPGNIYGRDFLASCSDGLISASGRSTQLALQLAKALATIQVSYFSHRQTVLESCCWHKRHTQDSQQLQTSI